MLDGLRYEAKMFRSVKLFRLGLNIVILLQFLSCNFQDKSEQNSSVFSVATILALLNSTGSLSNTATTATEADTFHTVGGSITGNLNSGTITLQLNNANNLARNLTGSFTFPTTLKNNTNYSVTILSKPAGVTCGITNAASGIVGRSNITNVTADCNLCGNSFKASYEACDDGNLANGDGCNMSCAIESGYTCTTIGNISVCSN